MNRYPNFTNLNNINLGNGSNHMYRLNNMNPLNEQQPNNMHPLNSNNKVRSGVWFNNGGPSGAEKRNDSQMVHNSVHSIGSELNPGSSSMASGSGLPPRYSISSTIDKNRILNSNATHSNLSPSAFPCISNNLALKNDAQPKHIGYPGNNRQPDNNQQMTQSMQRHNFGIKFNEMLSRENQKPPYAEVARSNVRQLLVNTFSITDAEFPALPNTRPLNAPTNPTSIMNPNENYSFMSNAGPSINSENNSNIFSRHQSSNQGRLQSMPNGNITNIPGSMLRDQYGIASKVASMRHMDLEPALAELTSGYDLMSLGLNLNSPENIHPSFAGPFQNAPLGPHDIDHDIPEYRLDNEVRSKLPPIKIEKLKDDVLFYIFFSFNKDMQKIFAAKELNQRCWHYHKEKDSWIFMKQGLHLVKKSNEIYEGIFKVFNTDSWTITEKSMEVDMSKLEKF